MSTSTPPRFPPAPSGDSSSRPDCRNQLFANGCSALAFSSEDASCHGCLLSSPKLYHYRPPGLHSFGPLPRFLLQSHTWARVPLNTRNRRSHVRDRGFQTTRASNVYRPAIWEVAPLVMEKAAGDVNPANGPGVPDHIRRNEKSRRWFRLIDSSVQKGLVDAMIVSEKPIDRTDHVLESKWRFRLMDWR
jgi:hypothetical protein